MSYVHKGVVTINGNIDPDAIVTESEKLSVYPEDDGIQISDFSIGDFEWWYFDVYDHSSGCFLKIVLHIGTNPLRTRVISQLAISLNTPESNNAISFPFNLTDMKAEKEYCNISISDKVMIVKEPGDPDMYRIKIDIPGFRCQLSFKSYTEGWKPLGKDIQYYSGKKKVYFSWLVPVPRAKVEGYCLFDGRKYVLEGAIGYHDHNYIKIDRKNPLYLDNLVYKWYWGRCFADIYTVIFCDVHFRVNRILSLMVAERNEIIYSSNNLIDCSILTSGYDKVLKAEYPVSLRIKSLDNHFPLTAVFQSEKILDRKDLLEGVNPVIKFLISRLISRPAYHGIFSTVRLEIKNRSLDGYGNYESMIFRSK